MKYAQMGCDKFVDETFSKAAVPGGGGVAALVGALGVALGGMVCNLTTGKKAYAQYEEDIQRIMKEADALKVKMMNIEKILKHVNSVEYQRKESESVK